MKYSIHLYLSVFILLGCDVKPQRTKVTCEKYFSNDSNCLGCYYLSFSSGESTFMDSMYVIGPDNIIRSRSFFNKDTLLKVYFYRKTANRKQKAYGDSLHSYFVNAEVCKYKNMEKGFSYEYFTGSNRVKTYRKYGYSGEYYLNEYDSLTNKLTDCRRYIHEEYERKEDSIIISPYIENLNDNLSNYRIIYVILNEKGLVKNTLLFDPKRPYVALPHAKHYDMIKVVCDSIGCFSVRSEYTEE